MIEKASIELLLLNLDAYRKLQFIATRMGFRLTFQIHQTTYTQCTRARVSIPCNLKSHQCSTSSSSRGHFCELFAIAFHCLSVGANCREWVLFEVARRVSAPLGAFSVAKEIMELLRQTQLLPLQVLLSRAPPATKGDQQKNFPPLVTRECIFSALFLWISGCSQ